MIGHHSRSRTTLPSAGRGLRAALAAALALFPLAARAEDAFTAAEARERVAAAATKPSVHAEPAEIEAALRAAGVPAEKRERLRAALADAVLPGVGSRIDGFLFLTRDPEWRELRRLFAEYLEIPAATVAPDAIRELQAYPGLISFTGLKQLAPDLLAAFDGFGGEDWGTSVELPAVAALTPAAAAGLARMQCLLILPAMAAPSPEAARALAAHEGVGVVLGGFPRLSPEAAAALAGLKSMRGMLLPDLEALDSVPLAARLAAQDHVFLPRVRSLAADVAGALAPNGGGELTLTGLDVLPVDVAAILAGSGYFGITLPAVLDPEPAAALAAHNGPLILAGPRPPRVETAAALARHAGELRLPGLRSLPVDVAVALAPHEGLLVCDQLDEMPVDLARALARHKGGLWLGGLRRIGPEAARLLAARPGTLALPALEEASGRALAALVAKDGVELPPLERINQVAEPDGSRDDVAVP